jgi:uncharacterized membrane protein YccF (DUF307 family)
MERGVERGRLSLRPAAPRRPSATRSGPVRAHAGSTGFRATRDTSSVRFLLNIIWFVLAGFWIAIGYTLAALICFVLIITIPFGIAALRIARFALWPFGRTMVKRPDAGAASGVGNILWLVLCGWWLALEHLITGIALCITIIGIPLGLANFKLIPVSLLPLGREIVSVDEARARGLSPDVRL